VPALLVIGLVFVAGVQGIPALISHVNESLTRPRLRMLLTLVGLVAKLGITGMMVYAPAHLVLSRGRVLAAMGKSYGDARVWSWLTAMIVLTGWMIKAPFDYLVSHPGRLLQDWGSDSVFAVLLVGVFLETLGFFYVFASATSIVMGKTGHE